MFNELVSVIIGMCVGFVWGYIMRPSIEENRKRKEFMNAEKERLKK